MKVFTILLLFPIYTLAQPNCNVFLWNKDTLQYQACQYVEAHNQDYYQFHWKQMAVWDTAIAICPYFAYPYREKAAPYIKAGNFVEWKKNMDKAVEYAPHDYLHVRASLRYKFFADYKGTLADIAILEELMNGKDIGYTSNGTYHLNILKGLCLKAMGKNQEAIKVIESQLSDQNHHTGLYAQLHLGVIYLEEKMYDRAIHALALQMQQNDLAENRYYMALAYRAIGKEEKANNSIVAALELYKKGTRMTDPYNVLFDQIYMEQIETAIKSMRANG